MCNNTNGKEFIPKVTKINLRMPIAFSKSNFSHLFRHSQVLIAHYWELDKLSRTLKKRMITSIKLRKSTAR